MERVSPTETRKISLLSISFSLVNSVKAERSLSGLLAHVGYRTDVHVTATAISREVRS